MAALVLGLFDVLEPWRRESMERLLREGEAAGLHLALFDREPLPRWSVGRVTPLGDACHSMHPFMGQGAAQAIEDGATLVDAAQLSKRLREGR